MICNNKPGRYIAGEASDGSERYLDTGPASYRCDLTGIVRQYNKAMASLWGDVSPGCENLPGWAATQLYHSTGAPAGHDPVARAIGERRRLEPIEMALMRANGTLRDVLIYTAPSYDSHGHIDGGIATVIDISSYTASQQQRIQEISAEIPGLMYQFKMTATGTMSFSYISEGSRLLLGMPPQTLYDQSPLAFKNIHEEDLPDLIDAIHKSYKTLGPFIIEFRINPAGGSETKWIRATSIPHRENDGDVVWNGLMMDITLTHAADTRFRLIRRTVEKAVEGIIITDLSMPDSGIIFANRAFYELTGYKPHEVIGSNCRFLQGPDTDPNVISAMRRKIALRQPHTCEILNYKKNGQPFWNSLTIIPMTDSFGVVTNYAGFQNDITERKEAEAKVALAKEELESFNYTVSHDLQGPLRIMSAFSRILTNDYGDKLGKEGKDYLGFIENNAKQMSMLIKGLLAFSKQGKAALNFAMTDLAGQVTQVVDLCRLDAENSKAAIKINPLTPAICDCDLIMQVWTNLISNAIKYSSKHEAPEIEIGQTASDTEIIYYVKDNGAGFDMKDGAKLFRPFQRMHASSEYEGTGVGLATVHRIITRHGGRIWAEAKKGEGATFFFTLREASAVRV